LAQLRECGCIDFLKDEVKSFLDSNLTGKLGLNVSEQREFLKGTVYGYVLAKTGKRGLAIKSVGVTDKLSKEYKKEA